MFGMQQGKQALAADIAGCLRVTTCLSVALSQGYMAFSSDPSRRA